MFFVQQVGEGAFEPKFSVMENWANATEAQSSWPLG